MAFEPRTFDVILDDMINFVRLHTNLTDFERGSVIRTILEASALEDDEQYFQMVQLLDAFSILTATGADLDDRAAEFNITRLTAKASSGEVFILDGNLTKSTLAFDVNSGDTTITLEDSSEFPTSGYPYTVRIGEGTTSVEDVSVSNNNTSTNILTVGALTNSHNIGERAAFVTGGADLSIASGIKVHVPSQSGLDIIKFTTVEGGTIVNGNYSSTPIRTSSDESGKFNNIGANKITKFSSSPPFDGALVINEKKFSGGRNLETDDQFRDRILEKIQSLSAGTPLALRESVLGIADPVTSQRVVTANIKHDMDQDEVIVYIDDGSGFIPDQVILPTDSLNGSISSGVSSITVNDASEFPSEGYLIISPEDAAQDEIVEYTSVDYSIDEITLSGSTVEAHDDGDEVALVEYLLDSSMSGGENFFDTRQWPIVRGAERVWKVSSSGDFTLLNDTDDYFIDRGRGEIQLKGSGLSVGDSLVVNYSYYTGVVRLAQQVINGLKEDEVTYPGVTAAGIIAVVETPTIRNVTVRISITPRAGFSVTTLAPQVQTVVENYISGLGIGESVILAEIVERAMGVSGMYNAKIDVPSADVVVGDNELPLPFNSSGESLITVS